MMTSVSPPLVVDDPRLDMFARRYYVVVGVMMPLATFAIILRFYARKKRGSRLALDDAFAVIAWIFCMALFSIFFDGKFSLITNTW